MQFPQHHNAKLFLEELNNSDGDFGESVCMISNLPLERNHITLPCNHRFNYPSLLEAIIRQKSKNQSNMSYNIVTLRVNQLQCPYCRRIHDGLLPFIPYSAHEEGIYGVNSPKKYCMPYKSCTWVYKSGKNKHQPCSKPAYDDELGCFCQTHHKLIKKVEKLLPWNEEMETYSRKFTVVQLKGILHERNLKTTGTKDTLIRRIVSNE